MAGMKRRVKIFCITAAAAVMLFLLAASALYFMHPEVTVNYRFESLRWCPWYSEMIYVGAIVKNKIVFSFYWIGIRNDFLPEKSGKSPVVEVDHTGYCPSNDVTIDQLILLDRIPLVGLAEVQDKEMIALAKAKKIEHIVLIYAKGRDFLDYNLELLKKRSEFWSELGVDHRVN